MRKICCVLILGFLLFTMVGCGSVKTYTLVDAVVVDKNFVPSSTYVTMMPSGKTVMPVTHHRSEEFNVTVEYEGNSFTIDSRVIYSSLEIGESIQVYKVDVYKKDGTYKRSYLQQQ